MPEPSAIGYDSWRPGQEDTIRRALALLPGQALVVEAPTGFGKSAVPAALSRAGCRVAVIVGTKDLQEQYARSFPWAAVVWGKNGYTCPEDRDFARRFRARWGRLPTVEECYALEADIRPCPDCPYILACVRASHSPMCVLNYHYAFYASWWRKDVDYVVLDEIHRLEPTLRDLVRVRVSERRRSSWGLPAFPKEARGVADYLEGCAALVERGLSSCEPEEAARRLRWVKQVRAVVSGMRGDVKNWFPIVGPDALEVRPVDVAPFTGMYTLRGTARVVAMSATPPHRSVLGPQLGMPLDWVSLPHIIPSANRPVYWVENAPRMNVRSMARDAVQRQAWYIAEVIGRYPSETVLVLTATWEHAVQLGFLLGRLVSRPVVVPDRAQARTAQTQAVLGAPRGSVVISASHWEGLDLRDDLCRAVVVAKVPFPDLADPVVRILLGRPGGRAWYDSQACLKAVQGIGRAVRHPDDWADGWIVDANWRRVARCAPAWFEVSRVRL